MKDVVGVQWLERSRLRLVFEGDEVREVDIAEIVPFKGVFEALKDPQYLAQVRVNPEIGTIVWPNGADLCPDVLYEKSTPIS
jgi:hypothetical protein